MKSKRYYMLSQVIVLALMTGAATAVDDLTEVAPYFPSPAELEVDRIGKAILAEGIPPREDEDHCVAANLPASELELPRLSPSAAMSLRENTCMDDVGVDSRYFMTFFGKYR